MRSAFLLRGMAIPGSCFASFARLLIIRWNTARWSTIPVTHDGYLPIGIFAYREWQSVIWIPTCCVEISPLRALHRA